MGRGEALHAVRGCIAQEGARKATKVRRDDQGILDGINRRQLLPTQRHRIDPPRARCGKGKHGNPSPTRSPPRCVLIHIIIFFAYIYPTNVVEFYQIWRRFGVYVVRGI
jgi:hypothetical protein